MDTGALKITAEMALAVLRRLALHYPRSAQGRVLLDEAARADALAFAGDYAQDCRGMSVADFVSAVDAARAESRFFPTSADIREAHRKAEQARQHVESWERQQAAREGGTASLTPDQRTRSAIFARIFTERRAAGLPMNFDEARRMVDEEMRASGGRVQ